MSRVQKHVSENKYKKIFIYIKACFHMISLCTGFSKFDKQGRVFSWSGFLLVGFRPKSVNTIS